MKLTFLVTLIGIFCFTQSYAQQKDIKFYKFTGKEVKVRDSADFVRIIEAPDRVTKLSNVFEYYKDQTPKLVGKTSKLMYLSLEGECLTYFPSGVKQQLAHYKNGNLAGDVYNYYPNGKPYTYKQYNTEKPVAGAAYNPYLIISCNDPNGKALVTDGNGYYIGYHDDFKTIFEEGNVQSGLKDGNWKGAFTEGKYKISFNEVYSNGQIVSGQSVDQDGKTYNYTAREIAPEFKGGEPAFNSYLSHHIRYPVEAKENNIQGRVFITFVVEKDGSLTDAKAVRAPSEDLADESLRVINLSPQWTPGLQFGRPVRVEYTIPIDYNLGVGR